MFATTSDRLVRSESNNAPVLLLGAEEWGRLVTVQRGGERLFLNQCCEPAEGTMALYDLASGEASSIEGFGRAEGADAIGRWLRVLTNGQQLILEDLRDPFAVLKVASATGLALGEASLAPSGTVVAVVGIGGNNKQLLYALDMETTAFLENGDLVAESGEDGLAPQFPAIDALGRVWYIVEDRLAGTRRTGIVADRTTGAIIEEFQYSGDVIDQNFDETGTWLVVTFADGTAVWRSIDDQIGVLDSLQDVTGADW